MEFILGSWEENVPLLSSLRLLKHITSLDYNEHMIGEAAKCYLALKHLNLENNMSCYRCGDYPVHLSFDVIRNVSCDVNPEDFDESAADPTYSSFGSFFEDAKKSDLSRAYLNHKSVNYNANQRSFRVKMCQNFPPVLSPKNFGSIPPYTRPLIQYDRPEEINVPQTRTA